MDSSLRLFVAVVAAVLLFTDGLHLVKLTNFKCTAGGIFRYFCVNDTEVNIKNISSDTEVSLTPPSDQHSLKVAAALICIPVRFPVLSFLRTEAESMSSSPAALSLYIMSLRFIHVLPLCSSSSFVSV